MTEPTPLAYARFFELTVNYRSHDVPNILKKSPTYISSAHINPDFQEILGAFDNAALGYTSFAIQEPVQQSDELVDFLKGIEPHEKPACANIYDDLSPKIAQNRIQKLKIPLLQIGGGDVRKDVDRIRRGVNLKQVIDEVLEDHNEQARYRRKRERKQQSNVTLDSIKEFTHDQIQREANLTSIQVSSTAIKYIKDALPIRLDHKYRFASLTSCLRTSTHTPRRPPYILKESDFDLELDSRITDNVLSPPVSTSCWSPDSPTSLEIEKTEKKSQPALQSASESLMQDVENTTTAAVEPVGPWEIESQSPLYTYSVQEAFVDIGTEVPINEVHGDDTLRPRKRRKVESEVFLTPKLLDPCVDNRVVVSNIRTSSASEAKLEVSVLQSVELALPYLNSEQDLIQNQNISPGFGGIVVEQLDLEVKIPFALPSMHEVMQSEPLARTSMLESFSWKSKPVLRSDEMLWKEPGLRLLDGPQETEGHIIEADYAIETEIIRTPEPKFDHANLTHVTAYEKPCDSSPFSKIGPIFGLFGANTCIFAVDNDTPGETAHPQSIGGHTSQISIMSSPKNKLARRLSNRNSTAEKKSGPVKDERLPRLGNDSLSAFLDLRGKNFKRPVSECPTKLEDIVENQIQSIPQTRITDEGLGSRDLTIVPRPSNSVEMKSWRNIELPVESSILPRYVFLNEILLEQQPLLIQFLERQVSETFMLIYRHWNDNSIDGPDLIINTTTCLIITNLQYLSQRPLPGQKTRTNLSPVHDRISEALEIYDCVMVLTHFLPDIDMGGAANHNICQIEFAAFCQSLAVSVDSHTTVVPLWIPCTTAVAVSDTINAWVWRIVQQHAYSQPCIDHPPTMIHDVTLWELLLVQAKMNPMAAQAIVGAFNTPKPDMTIHNDAAPEFGLRHLIMMDSRDRHEILDSLIGVRAVRRLCNILNG